MVISLSMVFLMLHSVTIYAPIAGRPVPHSLGHVRLDFPSEEEHHLEPQLSPAQVTHGVIGVHFYLSGHNWR